MTLVRRLVTEIGDAASVFYDPVQRKFRAITKHFTSLTDLRATEGDDYTKFAVVNDGANRNFVWTSDTTTPHDGAIVIAKASGRTGAWKLQYNGVLYPEWFGDVDTDATAAIQAALDYTRPVDGSTPIGAQVHLRKHSYPLSSPIKVYTGSQLVGEGPASKLVARSDFSGAGLIIAGTASATTTTYIESFTIQNIGFDPGVITGLWAIDLSNIADILHATIDGIWVWTAKGINLSSYLQHSYITRITSFGSCDQILWAKGNHNTFAHIDKEGGTGSTTDPYILIEEHALGRSQSNNLRHILIEGTTSVNKAGIKAIGTYDLTLEDVWVEPTLTDGHAVLLDDCIRFTLRGAQTHMTSTYSTWRVQNGSYGQIIDINSDAEDVAWQSVFSVDDTSMITCPQIFSRRATNTYPIDDGARVIIGAHIASTRLTTPVDGWSAISRARNVPASNLAVNGSFESGDYGWGKWGGAGSYGATQTFPASEVNSGLMCQFDTFTGASQGIVQSISISAAQVGHPITLAALIRLTGNGYVSPHFDGAGVTLDTGCQRVQASDEWHLMTATVIPTAAGSLEFGVAWRSCDAASVLKIDELCLIFGDEGRPGGGSFQQIELGGRSMIVGTAAPTTGTWKRGDYCRNSTPTAGAPSGWVCTSAGSPGTWTPEWSTTGQTTFTYAASRTLDCSAFSTHVMSDTMTGTMALTLTNGQDGDVIAVVVKQDGTGGRKVTGVTVSGRTVQMDSALTTINTAAMLTAGAVSTIVFRYYTAGGTAYCAFSIESEIAAAYT